MSAILTKIVQVTSRVEPIVTREATVFVCSECQCEAFYVYAIHGKIGQHLHLQCVECGETFCRGEGECE